MWWSCSPSGKLHFSLRETMRQNGACPHGQNAVLSMVDNNLNNYFKKRALAMHADNCVSQNKNRSLIPYIAWWVIVRFTDEVSLSFRTVGQTRRLVNGYFWYSDFENKSEYQKKLLVYWGQSHFRKSQELSVQSAPYLLIAKQFSEEKCQITTRGLSRVNIIPA